MARTLKKKIPVDIEKLRTIVYKKGFKSVSALAREMGRSDSYLDGQAKGEGFTESTVISLERLFGIKPEDYKLEVPTEKGFVNDDKNEVVAYAREITRLSNLVRTIQDELKTTQNYIYSIWSDVGKFMQEFGITSNDEMFIDLENGLPRISKKDPIYRYWCAPCDFWSGGIKADDEESKIIRDLMPESEGVSGAGVYKAYLPGNGCSLEVFYFCKAINNGTTFIFSNYKFENLHWENADWYFEK